MDPLLTPIKGRSRALVREGWPRGRTGRRIRLSPPPLSLSLTRTLVTPYCKRIHPPWAQDNTKAAGSPLLFSPLCVPSRADLSGLGRAATIYSSVQGPPGVETPTEAIFDHSCEYWWPKELKCGSVAKLRPSWMHEVLDRSFGMCCLV
jgi:hypothetical protein